MEEVLEKIEAYKNGIVQQFNHINNTIARDEQDVQTRNELNKMAIMIENCDRIVKVVNHIK